MIIIIFSLFIIIYIICFTWFMLIVLNYSFWWVITHYNSCYFACLLKAVCNFYFHVIVICDYFSLHIFHAWQKSIQMCVITGEKGCCFSLPFPQGGQSAQSHTQQQHHWRWSFFSAQPSRWFKRGAWTQSLKSQTTVYCDDQLYGLVCYFTLTNVIRSVVTTVYRTLLVITARSSATTQAVLDTTSPPQVWSSQIQTISCAIHHILLPG